MRHGPGSDGPCLPRAERLLTMDAKRLRELLEYSPESGVFTWLVSPARQVKRGAVAGNVERSGYRRIRLDGVLYRAARLAWLYVHGEWPSGEVDHVNHQRSDDRISNLRDVSHRTNCHNPAGPFAHGSTGKLGAHRNGRRFAAKIVVDGRSVWLGRHVTPDAASAAYDAAKRQLHDGVA